ncbi:MAG: signal peptide peptidase SppA [Pseudomonadota bacterium]
MKTFLLSAAGAFAAILLFFLSIIVFVSGAVGAVSSPPEKPDSVVLSLDLRDPLSDQAPTIGLAAFSGTQGFTTVLTKLRAAETDDMVKGLYIRASETSFGSARAEELRDALIDFQAAGKFVIAHSQGIYGTSSPSALRAITAADEVWLQPGGVVFANGLSFETEFLKGLFDNLSITADIIALYEYKNAPNTYQETTYTEPHREAMTALAQSLWDESIADIAADRNLPEVELRALLEAGPKSPDEALELSLVDTLGWPEDAHDAALERAEGAEMMDMAVYAPPPAPKDAPVIAIVGGEGPIVTGYAEDDLFATTNGFFSDNVAANILDAGRDEDVRAIVFRVDSPGGSPTASDQIHRAIERVQEMGKPVVVSMGSVAASGGYYVSTGADAILASDATITGSIGIFGGKFAISEGLGRIGVNIEDVTVGGDFANAFGPERFTDTERAEITKWLQAGYDRFLDLVAEGRNMSVEAVHEQARGRVWSGADAAEVGLVDEIGGFMQAIDKAAELAGVEEDEAVALRNFPAQVQGFEALEMFFGASASSARSLGELSALGRAAEEAHLAEILAEIAAIQSGEARAMGPMVRER